MQQLFGELGVDAVKLTHELRIFAAQLLYEMGVPLEVSVEFVRVGNGRHPVAGVWVDWVQVANHLKTGVKLLAR